ncbi:MAG: flavin reductase family protein [Pseudomonadota bacterium]
MTDVDLDEAALKRAFGSFATGVTVVCTIDETGAPRGFTASAFSPVSLDPPIILVCVAYRGRTGPIFAKAESFAVSVLTEDQAEVSNLFASPDADRFAATPWETQASGAPILSEHVAFFDCAVRERVDAGDHFILIGDVEAFDSVSDRAPLAYWRASYGRFDPAG